jgi:hypothetical protein
LLKNKLSNDSGEKKYPTIKGINPIPIISKIEQNKNKTEKRKKNIFFFPIQNLKKGTAHFNFYF